MLSAGGYPIVMFGPLHLPAILPQNPTFFAILRRALSLLPYPLFATFLAHFSAVLFHTLVLRGRLLGPNVVLECSPLFCHSPLISGSLPFKPIAQTLKGINC